MSNEIIYNILKNKDYIIRPFLFKIVKEKNLNTDELLLLIYLTNQEHPELDLKLINQITSLNNNEILEAFSSLTSKNLINTKIEKDGDKVLESISLENIYKLAATNINKNVTKENGDNIFTLFESEFGRTLSPTEYEIINAWINSGINVELIKEALKEAIYNGVSNLRYIDKIMYEWKKKGYKTPDDIKNNRSNSDKEKTEFFDYNWLDDNE